MTSQEGLCCMESVGNGCSIQRRISSFKIKDSVSKYICHKSVTVVENIMSLPSETQGTTVF